MGTDDLNMNIDRDRGNGSVDNNANVGFDFNKIAGLLKDRLLERVALKMAKGDLDDNQRYMKDQFSTTELMEMSSALDSLVSVKLCLEA